MWPTDYFAVAYDAADYWDGISVAFAASYYMAVVVLTTDDTSDTINAAEILGTGGNDALNAAEVL